MAGGVAVVVIFTVVVFLLVRQFIGNFQEKSTILHSSHNTPHNSLYTQTIHTRSNGKFMKQLVQSKILSLN